MKRREIIKKGLKSIALFSIVANLPVANAAMPFARVPLTSFVAFIDTLIPADITPSASQLGMQQRLVNHAKTIENYSRLLELGCQWLDAQSKTIYQQNFEMLTYQQREAIVTIAEASPKNAIPKMFFDRVLSDLFVFYYAHPAAWPGLGIDSPPQPKGYADYMKKPARKVRA